jgi:NifB/MoaA-like Fe-S oxidoreductase
MARPRNGRTLKTSNIPADTSAIEVGVKFQADLSGQINALRFYKAATNTGTHTGHLWTSSGTLLGSISDFCRRTISEVSLIQDDLRARLGTTFAFLGDEIYLRAGRPVPSRRHYGDYPQIEDGIGMVRSFANQFEALMRRLERKPAQNPEKLFGTIMTGTIFAPVLRKQVERMNRRFQTRLQVVAVENEYFGGDVSVAGLLTGGDFIAARERVRGEFAIIPRVALKSDEPVMLDGLRLEEVQKEFAVPLYAFDFSSLSAALGSELAGEQQKALGEAA